VRLVSVEIFVSATIISGASSMQEHPGRVCDALELAVASSAALAPLLGGAEERGGATAWSRCESHNVQ